MEPAPLPARRELPALGSARPVLRFPKPADRAPRPHSDISVTGPWATSSDWTVPGSGGQEPEVRVEITTPHTVNVRVGVGPKGWKVFHARYAVVTTLRTRAKDYGGRFRATIAGYRGSTFRAFGAWRCELR